MGTIPVFCFTLNRNKYDSFSTLLPQCTLSVGGQAFGCSKVCNLPAAHHLSKGDFFSHEQIFNGLGGSFAVFAKLLPLDFNN